MKPLSKWLRALALVAVLTMVMGTMPLIGFAAHENTYVNTGNQAADLIGVAKTQIGYTEGGNNSNKYSKELTGNANQPWCGHFISWCARQANIPEAIIPNTGLASAFKSIGTFHARGTGYIPKMGDLVVFNYGHVSIVERYDAATGKAWVIDGNWSDKVSSHSVSLTDSSVEGFTTPSYTTKVTELTAFNLVKPSVVLKGKSFSIGGLIASNKKITKVSIAIKDADGTTKINAQATPNAKQYDLKGLDSKVAFGTLVAGEYSYVVAATDESGASKRWTNTFEVVSEITMTIEDVKAPTALEQGKTFKIYGVITCLEELTQVSVGVYDSTNTYKTGGTAQPNAKTYDIHGIDNYVSFGSLANGSYTMRVAAKSANAYKTWEYPFTVGGTASFRLVGERMPVSVMEEDDFDVAGLVECNLPLAAVSAKILDANGEALQSVVSNPSANTYDLDLFNAKLRFGALASGSYTLRVAARSGSETTEWLYPFTVQTRYFRLSDKVVPTLLKQGKPFDIAGRVTGEKTIDALTVNILNASGEKVSTVTVNPKTTTFELHNVSDDVPFSKLTVGNYTLRIGVRGGTDRAEWLFPFEVSNTAITGDLNFDGLVDTSDTMLLYMHVSGSRSLSAEQLANVGFADPDMTTAMKLFAFTSGAAKTYP